MFRLARSLVTFIAGSGVFTAIAAVPESDLERLERELINEPVGYVYNVPKAASIIGGAALEQRWEAAFEKAEGNEKQSWALLLAMKAAPYSSERDFTKAKRWLEQAGRGHSAHSYRATVASMENDHEAAATHLKAAFDAQPSLGLISAKLFAMQRAPDFELDDAMGFLERMWQNTKTPPEARMTIAVQLAQSKPPGPQRDAWLATLEDAFAAAPQTAWVEALVLSRLDLNARRGDEAWEWLVKGKAAGAPAALHFDELYSFATSAGETASAEGVEWLSGLRLEVRPRSGAELIGWVRQSSDSAGAALLKKFADLALEVPLEWLTLNEYRALSDAPAQRQTAIELLQAHAAKQADDLEARYVLGRLLVIADDKKGSAKILSGFIEDAIEHVNRAVISPAERARSARSEGCFGLRFPADGATPDREEKEAVAQIYPREYRTAYPNAPYLGLETHLSTVGDLVVRALWCLHEADAPAFPEAFADWVERARPPFLAQFQLAQQIDGREKRENLREPERLHLASEITKRHFAQRRAHAADIAKIFQGPTGELPADLVQRLLERWMAERPQDELRIKWINLPYLIEAEKFEEARTTLAELEADPATHRGWLGYISKSLAKAAGDPALEIPSGEPDGFEMIAQEKEARIAHFIEYLKSTAAKTKSTMLLQTPSPLMMGEVSSFDRMRDLLIAPDAKLLPGNPDEVMYSWVMVQIDAALSLFETEFAYQISHSDFAELDSDRFAKIAAEVGEDNLSLAMVRAFYDGKPEPPEQFDRVAALAAKHPENERIRMSLAGKALKLGRYQEAFDIASKLTSRDGDAGRFAEVVKLICAQELNDTKAAQTAARALIPITYRRENLAWLSEQLPALGMFREAAELQKPKPYHPR